MTSKGGFDRYSKAIFFQFTDNEELAELGKRFDRIKRTYAPLRSARSIAIEALTQFISEREKELKLPPL